MIVKDKIVSWFTRNIIMPSVEKIDNPGFITIMTTGKEKTNIRELFLSECILVNIENEMAKYEKGNICLYSAGKNFGYQYSISSRFPTIRDEKRDFLNFAYFLVRWVESTYATKASHKIDYNSRIFQMIMNDYIICRKNGLGHIFSTGGIAGIWSWVTQDPTVEAVQPRCQGRGDKECEVIAAPYETLVKMGHKPLRCGKMETQELSRDYEQFNQIRPVKWASNSLRSLIDSGFFKYEHGQVTYQGERFFLCEASFMYILERELKKAKKLPVLWSASFSFGKRLAEISGKQDPCRFITDFFPALGFGDILCAEKKGRYEVYVNCFPWMDMECDYVMFRGLLSGVISGLTGRNVLLKKVEKDLSAGYLALVITE
jgi:hypothetical protein